MSTLILRPNDTGDEENIANYYGDTPNYKCVDEAVSDEDTTYIYSTTTAYQRDLYNLPNHTSETGDINYVKVYFRIKTSVYGHLAYAKPALKTGGTAVDGTQVTRNYATYSTYSQTWYINPVTSSAWTWADIDGLQIGVSLKATSGYYSICTQVYVEVDYTLTLTSDNTVSMDTLLRETDVSSVALDILMKGFNITKTVSLDTNLVPSGVIAYTEAVDIDILLREIGIEKQADLDTRIKCRDSVSVDISVFLRGASGSFAIPISLDVILINYPEKAARYVLEIHEASSDDLISILNQAYSIPFTRTVNEPATLSFRLPADDTKKADLNINNEIWLRDYETGNVIYKFRLDKVRDIR